MNESGPMAEIEILRLKGADQLNPARFRFIEVLARRSLQHEGAVKRILDDKLGLALATYRSRFERSQSDAQQAVSTCEPKPRSPLAELARHIAQHSPAHADTGFPGSNGSHQELKSIRNFRNTWSKLSVEKQVKQAIEQLPENAGPLNSHSLVLQSLALMRDIAPDYLTRFMSYADTLLWLEQPGKRSKPMPVRATRKPKAVTTVNAGDALESGRQP